LPKGENFYDATIEHPRSNKIVIVILVGAVGMLFWGFVGRIRSFVAADLLHKASIGANDSAVEFSRIILSPGEYWVSEPRDSPNYFYERARSDREADAKFLEDLEKEKKQGTYDCPYMFDNPAWCRKSTAFFFQKDPQNIAIDPKFDILIANKRKEPAVVDSFGIEISYAEMITVPLDDWKTTKVKVDGQYEILMPPAPTRVLVNKKAVDISPLLNEIGATRDTVDSDGVRSLLQSDFEWSNLPMVVWASSADPVSLPPGASRKVEVVLKKYQRMPNNVVIRFIAHTNYGEVISDYFYLWTG
jgi:hypothetical protein